MVAIAKAIKKIVKRIWTLPSHILTRRDRQALSAATQIAHEIQQWKGAGEREKISIGENCNSSWYLKQTINKKASYPFDWIFSSPEIVLHAIQDQFQTFLNKEWIFPINADKAGHTYYHSGMFNHRNPLRSQEDYDYYKRAAERFMEKLQSNMPLLFVCTVVHEPAKRPSWAKGFDRAIPLPKEQSLPSFSALMEEIKKQNPRSKFIYIGQYTGQLASIEITSKSEDHLWVQFKAKGKNDGVKYMHSLDDRIAKIIYQGLT